MSTASDDDDEFSEDNVLSTLFPSRLKTISPQKPIVAPSQSPAGAALPVAPVVDGGAPQPVAHVRAARLSDHARIQTAQSLWMGAQDGTSEPQRPWQPQQHHQSQSPSQHQNGAESARAREQHSSRGNSPDLERGSSTGRPARRSMPSGRLEALTLAVPVIDITDSTPDGGMRTTCGALLPDGYRVDDGSEKPYPCPIDSCGKRFGDLRGVGGHFQALCAQQAEAGDGPPMLGLILYLAGVEAPRSCKPCMEPNKKSLCIVGDDTLPPDVAALYGGSCAMCYYRHKKWHQQNKCTLESFTGAEALNGPPTRNGGNGTTGKGTDNSEYGSDEDSAQDNSKAPPRSSLMMQSAAARGEESDRRIPAAGSNGNSGMSGPTRTNGDIAFSNSYLISNRSVRVADGLGFNVTYLLPGAKLKLGEDHNNLRICSVATGVAKVKLGDDPEFTIGTSGMFKILPGSYAGLKIGFTSRLFCMSPRSARAEEES
ncbi:unnamed protein product [Parascedosporium putredinis]|uniref:Uncharacterized protein n=1 Tax=Parascedosporium putredinis TaxID=1442378 RepID=A0A9P1M4T1_9PEZI|nr:unnamed protein product [Parascedosporium putredinis]CAI7987339.1 unnamed protein product [Parascedosporium putredinis]